MASLCPRADSIALVSNVQRYCVHDGPGIRTVVFFLGCPLRCRWCQNPEALERAPVLLFNEGICVGCGACVEACPERANVLGEDGKMDLDRSKCRTCGDCVGSCHFKARQLSGKPWSVPALLEEIRKDRVVFANSGGGLTLSGGEPLMNPDFVSLLLRECSREGIHSAIETCGSLPWSHFAQVLPWVDLFLYDIKLMESASHERWTGSGNRLILENARRLASLGKRIIVRVPLIPGVNDEEGEFAAIARFAAEDLGLGELHILPFHQIGSSKYELVGRDYQLRELEEDNEKGIDRCRRIAEALGLRVSVGGTGFLNEVDSLRVAEAAAKKNSMFLYDL